MLNRVILIGRLTRDPELRYTAAGIPVARFTLAVDRTFTNQQGQRETDFIDIVVWRRQAEICTNNLSKGRLVAVEGRLQVRSYETQDGQKRRAAEVVADSVQFLDWPKTAVGTGGIEGAGGEAFGQEVDYNPDDVPF
ncbi:MAG: single-strand DNA-binding protein [Bacillota bacterium]|jgi:single-strand DNA-binding protein|nr:single-strand DNA-binding protein [Bacillota bacterium]MDK2882115.1 single-strand DNA-binding protein [Bacillota bacterium]MDK2924636.1 single-strand DNA-binding protein [Bacillota bacterium]